MPTDATRYFRVKKTDDDAERDAVGRIARIIYFCDRLASELNELFSRHDLRPTCEVVAENEDLQRQVGELKTALSSARRPIVISEPFKDLKLVAEVDAGLGETIEQALAGKK